MLKLADTGTHVTGISDFRLHLQLVRFRWNKPKIPSIWKKDNQKISNESKRLSFVKFRLRVGEAMSLVYAKRMLFVFLEFLVLCHSV